MAGMKFRFGLRTLLGVVVILAAALSWWVTWPQRSAGAFVDLMGTAPDEAEKFNRLGGMGRVLREYKHDPPYLEPHSRSLADVLLGRQTFTVVAPVHDPHLDGQPIDFTATMFFERGKFKGPIELDSRPNRKRD
jgi:hypothetical protein